MCPTWPTLQLHHAICLNISKDNRFWATKEGVKKRGLLCRIFFCAGITHSHVPMWWFPQVKVPTSLHVIYSKEMMMWTSIFEEHTSPRMRIVPTTWSVMSQRVLGGFWVTLPGAGLSLGSWPANCWCEHDYIWMNYKISPYFTQPESSFQWCELRLRYLAIKSNLVLPGWLLM